MSRRSVVLDTHHLATTDFIILKLTHKPHVQYFFLKKKEKKKTSGDMSELIGYLLRSRLTHNCPPRVDCSKWAP